MATPSQLHANTFKQLNDMLESYHEHLNDLDAKISKLHQEREVVRATLAHELHNASLKLPPDAIGTLAAACW